MPSPACSASAGVPRWCGSTWSRARRQPWPTRAPPQQRLENRYVIEGLMRGPARLGATPTALYSNTSGWQAITGSWRLPGVPVWATAGPLDYPNEALDKCTQPSFSGGRVYLSQWLNDDDARLRPHLRAVRVHRRSRLRRPRCPTADRRLQRRLEERRPRPVDVDGSLRALCRQRRGQPWRPARRSAPAGAPSTCSRRSATSAATAHTTSSPARPSTGYLWLYAGNGSGGWHRARASGSARVGHLQRDRRLRATSTATSGPTSWPGSASTGRSVSTPATARGGWKSTRHGRDRVERVRAPSSAPGTSTATGGPTCSPGSASTGYLWL